MRLIIRGVVFTVVAKPDLHGPEAILVEKTVYVRDQGNAKQNRDLARAVIVAAMGVCFS